MTELTLPVPDELQNLMAEMWAEITAPRNRTTGKVIEFELRPDQHKYLYWRGPRGEMFCYTPHPDTAGNYWAWTYSPRGKGSRSGKPHEWKLTDRVRCAKRKTAKSKAYARWQKARAEKEQGDV